MRLTETILALELPLSNLIALSMTFNGHQVKQWEGLLTTGIVEVFCEFGVGVVAGDVALVKDRPSANA
jgi:hypothetical protein